MDFISEIDASRKGMGTSRLFRMTKMEWREARWGLFFISPWLIGFMLFYIIPMGASLVFTTLRFQLSNPDEVQFVGLDNWYRMLFQDPEVWASMLITFRFALISLPIGMVVAFLLAVLLNSKDLMGRNIFRTLFYAPTMVPVIAGTLIWFRFLNPQGWLNQILQDLSGLQTTGVSGLRWFDDPSLIYIAYTFIGLWGIGNAILINLASLQNVPTELYDAAYVDGAGWWRRLWNVTLPMVSPVIFYNLILSLVGLMQYFLVPWVLNGGTGYPEGMTRFYMVYFYKQAFTFTNMGYGAALAWLLFIVALAITIFLFATARHWVYYAGEK